MRTPRNRSRGTASNGTRHLFTVAQYKVSSRHNGPPSSYRLSLPRAFYCDRQTLNQIMLENQDRNVQEEYK